MNNKRFIALVSSGFATALVGCASIASAQTTEYVPLTTVPGLFTAGSSTNPVTIIKGIYGLAIGVGSVIATVMLIIAGFEYMYQESITGKSQAKERITNAFLGLLVILGSYILLRTINPALVDFNLTLQGGSNRLKGLIAEKAYDDLVAQQKLLKEDQTLINSIKAEGMTLQEVLGDKEAALREYDCGGEDKVDCEKLEAEIKTLEDRIEENAKKAATAQIEMSKGIASMYVNQILENKYWQDAQRLRQNNGKGDIDFGKFIGETAGTYKSSIAGIDKQIQALEKVQTTDPAIAQQKAELLKTLKDDSKYLALAATYFATQNTYNNNSLDLKGLSDGIERRTKAFSQSLAQAGLSKDVIDQRVARDKANLITAYSMYEEVQEDCVSDSKILPVEYAQLCSNS